jgi:replication fork clamp-binding protein CrfC
MSITTQCFLQSCLHCREEKIKSEIEALYLRETSPDIFEECFEDLEDYIKTKLDIDTSLPLALLTAFGNSVTIHVNTLCTHVILW